MGKNKKPPKPQPVPVAAPVTKPEDESVVAAGDAEKRRLLAQFNRSDTATSKPNTIFG